MSGLQTSGNRALLLSAFAVLLVLFATAASVDLGPVSGHMLSHLALMNVVAPVAAAALVSFGATRFRGPPLWLAATAQLVALAAWHFPPTHAALSGQLAYTAASAFLATTALFFWIALQQATGRLRWRAVFALLITGKIACLIGSLLIFAPRVLYSAHHAVDIADQQMAGFLMIVACPLSYLVAGVMLTAGWLADLDETETYQHQGSQ